MEIRISNEKVDELTTKVTADDQIDVDLYTYTATGGDFATMLETSTIEVDGDLDGPVFVRTNDENKASILVGMPLYMAKSLMEQLADYIPKAEKWCAMSDEEQDEEHAKARSGEDSFLLKD